MAKQTRGSRAGQQEINQRAVEVFEEAQQRMRPNGGRQRVRSMLGEPSRCFLARQATRGGPEGLDDACAGFRVPLHSNGITLRLRPSLLLFVARCRK